MLYTFDDGDGPRSAHPAVLRDAGQPGHVRQRLDRLSPAHSCPGRPAIRPRRPLQPLHRHMGAVQHRQGLLAGPRSGRSRSRRSWRNCRTCSGGCTPSTTSSPCSGTAAHRLAGQRAVSPGRPTTTGDSVTYSPGMIRIAPPSRPDTYNRSFRLTAVADIPQGGAEGALVALGGVKAGGPSPCRTRTSSSSTTTGSDDRPIPDRLHHADPGGASR